MTKNQLVKKLKAAKFPYKVRYAQGRVLPDESELVPNMEELSDACGQWQLELHKIYKNYWWAVADDGRHLLQGGRTPEEALSLVWLELYKKERAERKARFIAKTTAKFDTPRIRKEASNKFEKGNK